ncbi:stage II sporulation protein P [Pelagirhabdus alkalitolerans]|uniref:Stage II sporulation protein P n=1 Tax=Pelagirhabdus alkalitolerans TaxID=1612202 RepID=A0A1G6HWM3_9BACI|nr:stage II sporulation protein P [Pelagirhabdus alkalitolerans]SDB97866.1 stage II sporulation protein P [Pelagirhabdus alkalitolerans]
MRQTHYFKKYTIRIVKAMLLWTLITCILYLLVGLVVFQSFTERLPFPLLREFNEQIDQSIYLHMVSRTSSVFKAAPDESEVISTRPIQSLFTMNGGGTRTLFGNELPGFSSFNQQIIVAQSDTNYSNLPVELTPPMEIFESKKVDNEEKPRESETEITGDPNVFIYNTHTRESFLPHLDGITDPSHAFDVDVNVTLISQYLKDKFEKNGILTLVDETDFTDVLTENGWDYWRSYDASQPAVKEVINQYEAIQYVFDVHRDSRRREDTTITIDGEDHARIFFVIGSDFQGNETNIAIAKELHNRLEAFAPGISRGVVQMGGQGRNGVYNQDLLDNSLLIEFGGVDNTLEEMYRLADVFVEVFSEYFWHAEPVNQ